MADGAVACKLSHCPGWRMPFARTSDSAGPLANTGSGLAVMAIQGPAFTVVAS